MKQSLTRKLGPLPVWAWTIITAAAVWYYRNRIASNTQTGTGTGSVTPTSPGGSPVTLGPGESVYDPATGQLTSTPLAGNPAVVGDTGTGGGATGGFDPGQAMEDLANAIDAALPSGQNDTTNPVTPPSKQKPSKQKTKGKTSDKGKVKTKPGGKSKPKTGGDARGRSNATARTRNGGRVKSVLGARFTFKSAVTGTRTVKPGATASKGRTRATHNTVSHPAVNQRPAATHPAPPSRATRSAPPAPRPSAPPPRTQRTVAPPKQAPAKGKKR